MIGSSRLLLDPTARPRLLAQRAVQGSPLLRHVITPPGLRPAVLAHLNGGKRWKSKHVVEDNAGHISLAKNESILFFDNIFPLGLSTFFLRRWRTEEDLTELLQKFDNSSLGITDPVSRVKRAIPADLPIRVTEVIPRLKDGGAFIKFSHTGNNGGLEARTAVRDLERALVERLREAPLRSWFNPFASVRVGLVRGVPWLEDLYRPPASRLKVEFCPPNPGETSAVELSQETLYSIFRVYGKLAEITPQPFDSKVMPRYAYVDFSRVRDAVMARNCLHGFFVSEALGGGKGGTKIRLSYESRVKPHHIWNWLSGYPRIFIPLAAALLAAFTVAVFDPIREFFIGAHIQDSFNITNSRAYRWFKRQTFDFGGVFTRHKEAAEEAGLQALWTQRKDIIDLIKKWLLETADTFIVVQGPRGSGTRALVIDQALDDHANVLILDCKPVVEARGESATIRRLAATVGYRPVFSWAHNLSSLADLAVQGTTGVKTGFSETLESQIVKILQTTASALKKVSLADHGGRDDKDAEMSEDAYLEAHPEKRAVVVIDNFLHRSENGGLLYDKIAEWAAALVQSNIAHVIFLTHDSSYSKSLSKSLPDRLFRQVALGDLEPEVAKKYVLSQLEGFDRETLSNLRNQEGKQQAKQEGKREEKQKVQNEGNKEGSTEGWFNWNKESAHDQTPSQPSGGRDLAELDSVINTLGGRLTDLEFLARRLKSGQSPKQAVADIVEQSSSEIIKMFLLGGKPAPASTPSKSGTSPEKAWSNEQAWHLIREIAVKGSLRYNEVLLSPTFALSTTSSAADGAAAVDALDAAELITVTSHRGRPQMVKAGRPVYQAAFALLAEDKVLKARMDLSVATELVKIEVKNIDKVEAEMALLATLPKQPAGVDRRAQYLVDKLNVSHAKIVALEAEIAGLKKVLKQEA